MKNTLRLNHAERTIVMDKTFAKFAANTMSPEYAHLQQVRQDYPLYTVVQRHIRKNENKKTYRGLTYDYMEDYIMTHGSSETVKANLKEFYEKRLIAECHGKAFRYPAIKRWFLEKYPEIVDHGMEKTAQIIEIYDEPEETKHEKQDASA
jgi:excinuclease UvrABC ATPase subunit